MAVPDIRAVIQLRRYIGTISTGYHLKSGRVRTEKGLELYSYSFYDLLPSANNIHTADCMSDYAARRNVPDFLRPGAYDAFSSDNTSASGRDLVALGDDWNWGWRSLRNINYFIVNCTDPAVSLEVRQHYIALANFFRAYFYFEKVKRYGDVPWIGKPLDVEDEKLYGPRDPRTLVMDSVLADLNYSIQYLKTEKDTIIINCQLCSQIDTTRGEVKYSL